MATMDECKTETNDAQKQPQEEIKGHGQMLWFGRDSVDS